jgi:hypothetical protein
MTEDTCYSENVEYRGDEREKVTQTARVDSRRT